MEKMNVLTLIITLVVGVILTGALLGPVISDATETERTFENEGVFNYGVFTPEDNLTLTYSIDENKFTVNGVEVPAVPDVVIGQNKSYSILATENLLLRYGSTSTYLYLQIVGKDTNGQTVSTSVGTGGELTATIVDGKLSVVATGTPATDRIFDFEKVYCIVPSEDIAVMKIATGAAYIKGDSPLYATGLTNITNWNNMFHFEGNYTDGIEISSSNLATATYDNITWNIEAVDGYIDLYKLTSIEFDIHYNDTTTHAVYSYFGVPSSVTAEKSQHLTDGQIALMGAIPVMVIVALLMVAVGAIALRRND